MTYIKQRDEAAECWRKLPIAPQIKISSHGRVKTPKCITFGSKNSKGYLFKSIKINGVLKFYRVHRLVLWAFRGPSDLMVNHKNGIKTDNRLSNLEYVTSLENVRHAFRTGLGRVLFGEKHGNSRLTEKDVRQIRQSTINNCKLAKSFGVSETMIRFIKSRRNWKHVK